MIALFRFDPLEALLLNLCESYLRQSNLYLLHTYHLYLLSTPIKHCLLPFSHHPSQNHSPTNNPILIWLINLHIDLVMRAESSPSTLQHQKLLLFNHRNLAAVTLLRGANKFTETIAAQAMTTLFDDDHLLVLEFLQTRWTSEATLKPSEKRPTCHQSP